MPLRLVLGRFLRTFHIAFVQQKDLSLIISKDLRKLSAISLGWDQVDIITTSHDRVRLLL